MSIEARLYAALTGHAGLAALVGPRVHPIQLPQASVLPAVTYLRVSTMPVQHRQNQTPTYSLARFQLDGWATGFDAMIALRRQIRLAMGTFDLALLVGDRDILEAEPERWRCTMDYILSFVED